MLEICVFFWYLIKVFFKYLVRGFKCVVKFLVLVIGVVLWLKKFLNNLIKLRLVCGLGFRGLESLLRLVIEIFFLIKGLLFLFFFIYMKLR